MLARYQPDLSRLNEREMEIALRVIEGSGIMHKAFVKEATRSPKDAKRVRLLAAKVRRERDEQKAGDRSIYPSFSMRPAFMGALVKRRILPALQNAAASLSITAAYNDYQNLIQNPDSIQNLFGEPVNHQNGQNPTVLAIGCIDSRIDCKELLMGRRAKVLLHRTVAAGIEDATNRIEVAPGMFLPIAKSTAESLTMAVKMGVQNVVIVPHGRCGGVRQAAQLIDAPKPEGFEDLILWQMAQARREIFEDIRRNEPDYYLDRLDMHDCYVNDHDRFLQAVEICAAVRDLRVAKTFVSCLPAGRDVTVSSVYMDLRTMNPHMIRITGSGEGDWEMIRLTDHPEIPCPAHHAKAPKHTHSAACSCHRGRQNMQQNVAVPT